MCNIWIFICSGKIKGKDNTTVEFENVVIGEKLSEYHTGFRGFTREILEKLPLEDCSDDFIFDNEMLALILYNGFKIGEISCPTKYFKEASSINFARSCKYGLEVLKVSILYRLAKMGLPIKLFNKGGQALDTEKELVYYFKKENTAKTTMRCCFCRSFHI